VGALSGTLRPVLGSEEIVQQSVCRIRMAYHHGGGILLDVDEAEILLPAARFGYHGEAALSAGKRGLYPAENKSQPVPGAVGERTAHGVHVLGGIPRDLTGEDRRNSLQHCGKLLAEPLRGIRYGVQHLLRLAFQQAQPVLARRRFVLYSRQHPAHGGNIVRDTLHAVDNAPVPDEDYIAVTSHYLCDEGIRHDIAYFIGALEIQSDNALKSVLAYCHELAAGKVLSQQHAEHRRLLRILECGGGEVHPGAHAVGGEHDFLSAVAVCAQ